MSKAPLFTPIDSVKGLSAALIIGGAWAATLYLGLTLPLAETHPLLVVLIFIFQTFLYTGLFITAHDAMHGTAFPANRKINNAIGSLAVWLYALFSYARLKEKHWEHHRNPASEHDPDYHDGEHEGAIAWYFHFMVGYMTWRQLFGLAVMTNVLLHLFSVPLSNILLLWALPSILSTVQLFYFGTYLPHRNEEGEFADHHRARSNNFSPFWSFITCYHFGYHWEHHAFPYLPWWKLAGQHRKLSNETGST